MSLAHAVTVTLDDTLNERLRTAVMQGGWDSPEEFIRTLLENSLAGGARESSLHEAIERGVADADAGRVVDLDEGFETVLTGLRERQTRRRAV